jgi:hypothetical protein
MLLVIGSSIDDKNRLSSTHVSLKIESDVQWPQKLDINH